MPNILTAHLVEEPDIERFAEFHCGDDDAGDDYHDELNRFLPEDALANGRDRFSMTYVFYDGDSPVAYAALACTQIKNQEKQTLDPVLEESPFPSIPALLLGRFAVNRTAQGGGHGQYIMDWIKQLARDLPVGCRFIALHVQATNAKAIRFYERAGFILPAQKERRDKLMLFDLVERK